MAEPDSGELHNSSPKLTDNAGGDSDQKREEEVPTCADPETDSSEKEKPNAASPPKNTAATKPKLTKAESEAMRKSDNKPRQRESSIDWPTTLEGFGYAFNEEGILKDINTGGPFNFMFSEDDYFNQKRYEAIGEVVEEEVYKILEERGGLKKKYVPEGTKAGDPRSFIFVSDDVMTNPNKLMVLIHGSGVVRAGQWTRKLIINNSLDHGTQLPFINRAQAEGYAVVVLNTNLNSVTGKGGKKKKIPKNGSPEDHSNYVWTNIIKKTKAKKIAIVAHSYGGVCTVSLAKSFRDDFLKRVFAIAFTDSVHSMSLHSVKRDIAQHFEYVAINWCASDKPIDTPLRSYPGDSRRVSAGHTKHEWTSWSSYESIFNFFEQMDRTGRNTIGVEPAKEVKSDDDLTAEEMDTNQQETPAKKEYIDTTENIKRSITKSDQSKSADTEAMETAEDTDIKATDTLSQEKMDAPKTTSSEKGTNESTEASSIADEKGEAKEIAATSAEPDEHKQQENGDKMNIPTGGEAKEGETQQEKEETTQDASNMETEADTVVKSEENAEEQEKKRSKIQEEL